MAVICAWCKIVLRAGTLPASHGICSACLAQFDDKPLQQEHSGVNVETDHEPEESARSCSWPLGRPGGR